MELTAKERQGRGLDVLAAALRPYVEQQMSAAIEAPDWVTAYQAKESQRLGRPYLVNLDDPRRLLQMIRYERASFPDIDGSQRAWLEELIQAGNRAAHTTEISQRQADRALDTMVLLSESLGLVDVVQSLIRLRLPEQDAETQPSGGVEDDHDSDEVLSNQQAKTFPVQTPRGIQALTADLEGVRIVVLYGEAVNLALTHNGVSPVRSIEITNTGDQEIVIDRIDIAIDPPPIGGAPVIGMPLKINIGAVQPGGVHIVQGRDLAMMINPAVFLALDEAVPTTIRLTVSTGGVDYTTDGGIRLLTADEWWAAGIPESLAAFVRPNDPALTQLLQEASQLLAARTGSAALDGYQAGARRVQQIAEAVFDALSARKITYVEPPPSFEGTGQRIRSHGQVLTDRMGTCLDLACLYAAALEQAGIHPILSVFDGHAFTGYLTEDDQLPTVVLDRSATVITLADSDFFDAIELTSACQPGTTFADARNATGHWWSADIEKLRFLLDVTAAHHRVKPLPTIRQVGDTRVIEVVRDQAWEPARRSHLRTESRSRLEPQTTDTPPRIRRWERSLLDMTYANPLLRRKNASSVAIQLPNGSLDMFENLITGGQELRLVADDEIAQIHQAQGARTAADIDPAAVRTILEREHRLFVALKEVDYQRRLRSLARRSKTAIEETGSDNLYLTLGTLEWTDGGRNGAAPLFLVPIKLRGGRGVVPFSISYDDSRERVPNYCLIEKLKTYGLELPDLEMPEVDESGIDIGAALAAIRTAILQTRNTVDFHVEETAHLALLQFSTLEMWQDLRRHWQQFMQRPAVEHLVENPGLPFNDGIEPPEPKPSDEATTFLPIAADGSQIDAVRWAAAGKTFILEGPPGTGKSQTITNLIANSMALGQRVLFVAEKSAALEVVKHRLDEIGLGVFSLDAHGRTQSVAAIRDQLRGALEEYDRSEAGWEPLQSAYGTITEGLARYPVNLHQEGPAGLSAWQARQLILEQAALGGDEATAVVVPRSVVLGDTALTELYADAQGLSAAIFDLPTAPAESPWRLSGALDVDQLDRERISRIVAELQDATTALAQHHKIRELAAWLTEQDQFEALADWLDTARSSTAWPTGPAGAIVTQQWIDEAHRRQDAVAGFRREQDQQLGSFTPAALRLGVADLLTRSQEIDKKFFGKKKRRIALLAELCPVLRADIPLAQLTSALHRLESVATADDQLHSFVAGLPGVDPRPGWSGFNDQDVAWFEAVVGSLLAASRWRQVVADLPDDATPTVDDLDRSTERLLSEGKINNVGGDPVRRYGLVWAELSEVLEADQATISRWLDGRSRDAAVTATLADWGDDARGTALVALQRLVRLNAALHRFEAAGVDDLVRRAVSGELSPVDIEAQFRMGVAQAVLEERLATTGLSGFDEVERDRRIELFSTRGAEVRRRMPNELRARIIQGRSFDPSAHLGNVGELRAELERRRGGRTVRQLLHDFAGLIAEITPCFLMSPHSVARFLPPTADFDLVVFDEASQIRVPEAIGAIGRAKATVIVGDSKQMPPTSMFATGGDDLEDQQDDEAALVPVDLESILSEAVESQFPRKLLSWHFRSRDESLIAFSNSRYYEGRLSSFPVPPRADSTSAIEFRRIDGTWEGGGSGAARVNRAEASAIVDEVRQILIDQPNHSVGVVTFNSQQRDLILDLIESDADETLARQLQKDEEPLFVKNLENVQGDERDIILFSLAFSDDSRGRIPLNWGPLTRAGGERRLNVAITRAKERVMIFGSFDPRRLDLSNSSSQGLSDLKDYLMLAANPASQIPRPRRDSADKHLQDVALSLSDTGLEVQQRVGLSDFVVDLAVRQPGSEDWVAVLLDGPEWANRESVGDRETLPATILHHMHWSRVERIWLPSWLRDPKAVVSMIFDAATAVSSGGDPAADDDSADQGSPTAASQQSELLAEPDQSGMAPLRARQVPETTPPREGTAYFRPADQEAVHDAVLLDGDTARGRAMIKREIEAIIAAEGPVLRPRLVTILANRFGISRVRQSRREQLRRYLDDNTVERAVNGDLVVWPPGVDPAGYAEFRVPADGEKREITTIPYEELRNAMVHVAKASYGAEPEELLRATAHVFGVTRLASVVRPRLEGVLSAALGEGCLVQRDTTVHATVDRTSP